jgi:hypothetical protein
METRSQDNPKQAQMYQNWAKGLQSGGGMLAVKLRGLLVVVLRENTFEGLLRPCRGVSGRVGQEVLTGRKLAAAKESCQQSRIRILLNSAFGAERHRNGT